jgi:signal transduction histidine kinase
MTYEVFIIDDDRGFRKLLEMRLKAVLKQVNFTVFEGIAAARAHLQQIGREGVQKFDLAVLDEHLPDGRGNELISEGWFQDLGVLSVSSDASPDMAGTAMKSGAAFFLAKRQISDPLFQPLVLGLVDRNKLQRELMTARLEAAKADTIKTLVNTLRHEINNPLGAVLGAAYLMGKIGTPTPEQREAAELVETSGKRIKHVLDQLSQAVSVAAVSKASHVVFHIPGDAPWEQSQKAVPPKDEDKE